MLEVAHLDGEFEAGERAAVEAFARKNPRDLSEKDLERAHAELERELAAGKLQFGN